MKTVIWLSLYTLAGIVAWLVVFAALLGFDSPWQMVVGP